MLKRNTGNTAWVTDTDTKFLYDGWNLIGEYSVGSGGALTAVRSYVWGLDWSGSRQGAGGVGGLLMVRDVASGANYQPAFDGNGNLMALVNRSTGALDAAYEYDAFGNTLRASGSYAATDVFRFSTKFTDDETGLVYYGYRYYSPSQGRFLNQDPIEEQGGLNLYGFVGNNGMNHWDYLGMHMPGMAPYGFGPVGPMIANSAQVSLVVRAGNAIGPYNQIAQASITLANSSLVRNYVNPVLNNPTTRLYFGTTQIMSGASNMVVGSTVAGAGTAATFSIPLAGQVVGPLAVALGSGQVLWGANSFRAGVLNASAGLSGQGFPSVTPLPLFNVNLQPSHGPSSTSITTTQSNSTTNSGGDSAADVVQLDKFTVTGRRPTDAEIREQALLERLRADAAHLGSDEWRDAHTNPSHWKASVLKGLAAEAVMRAIANPASPHAAAFETGARAAQSDYQMEQDRLFAIEENQRIQSGKAL